MYPIKCLPVSDHLSHLTVTNAQNTPKQRWAGRMGGSQYITLHIYYISHIYMLITYLYVIMMMSMYNF